MNASLQRLMTLVATYGGMLALNKDPDSPTWTVSAHWFPEEGRSDPASGRSVSGIGETLEEAISNIDTALDGLESQS